MAADSTQKTIDTDMVNGKDAGVMGTPAFFIVGPTGTQKKINGAYPFDTFKDAIQNVQPTK